MEKFPIERGIPIPPVTKAIKFNYNELEVGESMLLPDIKAGRAAVIWAKRSNRKFICRRMIDGKARIWRQE